MTQVQQKRARYGWVITASCFLIQAIGVGGYVSYGVFFNPLMNEFGWSRATVSGASSLAFITMGLLGMLIGRLNDRIGPRKLMTITAVFLGLSYLAMTRVTTVWQLYLVFGIIGGIGLSSVDVIALTTIARWFSRKRGVMTGMVKVGTGAGQLVFPLAASVLIVHFGWRNAYAALGIAILILLVAIAQLLRRDPSQVGLPNDREQPNNTDRLAEADMGLTLREAAHTTQLWLVCTVNMALVFCLMIILVHIVPHARDIGVSATRAAGVLSSIGGVSMLGRFVAGLSIDRLGSKRVLFVCILFLITGLLWLQIADRLWMLYLFACIYGIAHGGIFTAVSPIIAEMFGIRAHGALFGIMVFFGTVGGSAGPIVAGLIFDRLGSYALVFWLNLALSFFALALVLVLKPAHK